MRVVETLLLVLLAGFSAQERTTSKGPIPGSPHKVSNNDTRVRNAMLIGIYAFNNQSNDKFLFKVSHIKDAHIQIVKGIKFLLEAKISRTVCLKGEPSPDLDKCHFQPRGKLHQILSCHFEVWAIPWKNWMKSIFFMCHP